MVVFANLKLLAFLMRYMICAINDKQAELIDRAIYRLAGELSLSYIIGFAGQLLLARKRSAVWPPSLMAGGRSHNRAELTAECFIP